jgi:branched-chain amino acid transport system permease protein
MANRSSWRGAFLAAWPAIAAALLVVIPVVLLETFGSRAMDRMVAQTLCTLIVVVGLSIFIGNSGVYSFGHITFMAVGAYSAALLTMRPSVKHTFVPGLPEWLIQAQVPPLLAVAVGVVLALVLAALLAIPLMRLSGLTAGIATLAVLVVANQVLSNASAYTGGRQTLIGVAKGPEAYGILALAVVAIGIAYAFQRSRAGLLLRATREDPAAAASVGAEIVSLRRVAFVISAGVVALGGGLYAETQRTVTADSFFTDTTFITLMMLVVGGVRSLAGAVTGVLLITFASEMLRRLEAGTLVPGVTIPTGTTEVVLALVMLFVLIRRPLGLTGGREIVWPFRGALDIRRPASAAARPAAGSSSQPSEPPVHEHAAAESRT